MYKNRSKFNMNFFNKDTLKLKFYFSYFHGLCALGLRACNTLWELGEMVLLSCSLLFSIGFSIAYISEVKIVAASVNPAYISAVKMVVASGSLAYLLAMKMVAASVFQCVWKVGQLQSPPSLPSF